MSAGIENNEKLWAAIGEYANAYREYLDARGAEISGRRTAFDVAQKRITELIGPRSDLTKEKFGGNYDPAAYA